ncbi:hypothetical protein L1049_019488 [Liquidambar formosana]|uniref:Uncharacterized protein n=1 Tax=Liquidambar formosana TaxID=63359 RepID=A0AAP0S5Y6_LIQFO
MASLVSISSSPPLSASETLIKEIRPRKSALGRLSSQATSRTAVELLATSCSNKGMFSVNWSRHRHLALSRHFCEPSCHLNVICSTTTMIISGYWVGPDIEDGWGFVEAFVYQIF